jgi:hypothetical protein
MEMGSVLAPDKGKIRIHQGYRCLLLQVRAAVIVMPVV